MIKYVFYAREKSQGKIAEYWKSQGICWKREKEVTLKNVEIVCV